MVNALRWLVRSVQYIEYGRGSLQLLGDSRCNAARMHMGNLHELAHSVLLCFAGKMNDDDEDGWTTAAVEMELYGDSVQTI